MHVLGADDRALAHAAGNDGGVARHAATRGEHRLRRDDAVKVLGGRLIAHEDDVGTVARTLLSHIGIEDGDATRRTGTRRQPLRDRSRAHARVDHRMEKLTELIWRNTHYGGSRINQLLIDHVRRH